MYRGGCVRVCMWLCAWVCGCVYSYKGGRLERLASYFVDVIVPPP